MMGFFLLLLLFEMRMLYCAENKFRKAALAHMPKNNQSWSHFKNQTVDLKEMGTWAVDKTK